MTLEPRFSGLVLDHQGLEELELKNHPKTAAFDQIWHFLSGFLVLVLLKVDGRVPNPLFLDYLKKGHHCSQKVN